MSRKRKSKGDDRSGLRIALDGAKEFFSIVRGINSTINLAKRATGFVATVQEAYQINKAQKALQEELDRISTEKVKVKQTEALDPPSSESFHEDEVIEAEFEEVRGKTNQ
jgi:hypothetical protein